MEWILPDFTTTTEHDRTIGAMTLMSTLKAYVSLSVGSPHVTLREPKRAPSPRYATYSIFIECGIPSVTLDGEKSDWEEIYRRLARLDELGDEPAVWARMLRPIVRRFVGAFDGAPDVGFWERVADMDGYCGRDLWSGWITAFCVWSPEGRWLPPTPASETIARGIPEESASDGTAEGSVPTKRGGSLSALFKLGPAR